MIAITIISRDDGMFDGVSARPMRQRRAMRVICVQYSPGRVLSSATAEQQGMGEKKTPQSC